MLVEAAILGRNERLLDELGDGTQRHVDSTDDLEPAHRSIVAVEYAAALIGLEGLDRSRARAAIEPAGAQPQISEVNR